MRTQEKSPFDPHSGGGRRYSNGSVDSIPIRQMLGQRSPGIGLGRFASRTRPDLIETG